MSLKKFLKDLPNNFSNIRCILTFLEAVNFMPFRNISNSESIRWLEKLLFNLLTQNTVCWIRKWLWTNIVTLSSLSLKTVSFLSSLFFHWEKWQGNKKSLFSIDEGRSYFTGETIEWARGKRMGSIQSWEGRKLTLTFLSFTKNTIFLW